ncbi:MAG: NrdH-redoxin [Caldithrix sp.]|nr:NrdH-redoxin [Caldithrix sp.]
MKSERQPKVIIFTTPTCPHCNTAKRYFKQNSIKFRDVDVSRDQKAAQDMQRRTGQSGVPVILINNRPVVGFDKSKINRMLGIN